MKKKKIKGKEKYMNIRGKSERRKDPAIDPGTQ